MYHESSVSVFMWNLLQDGCKGYLLLLTHELILVVDIDVSERFKQTEVKWLG